MLAYAGGTPVPDGLYQVTFRLHDVDRGEAVAWQEAQTVRVEESRFEVALGVVTPVDVSSAGRYRFSASGVDADGVAVGLASDDGLIILKAGTPSTTFSSPSTNDGIEVQGAQGFGLFIGRADQAGVYVGSSGDDGVLVLGAEGHGLAVGQSGDDGVHVARAGIPSANVPNVSPNGFEVRGAEGFGLFIGRADLTGVHVNSAGQNGITVNEAGAVGIEVSDAASEAAYFKRAVNASATLRNHVVLIENTATSINNGPDVLALKSSADPATAATNFITFFKADNTAVGAVDGNGSGGVTYKSGGGRLRRVSASLA